MKQILILLFVFSFQLLQGQKLKTEKVSYPILQHAKSPLPDGFKHYSVKIIKKDLPFGNYKWKDEKMVDNYFKMHKYQYSDVNDDFQIVIDLGNKHIKEEKTVLKRDKKYGTQLKYGLPLKVRMLSKSSGEISEEVIRSVDKMEVKVFGHYHTFDTTETEWEKKRPRELPVFIEQEYKKVFKLVESYLAQFDDRIVSKRQEFYYVKDAEKQRIRYDRDNLKSLRDKLSELAKTKNTEGVADLINVAIIQWQKWSTHKKTAIAFAGHYNLAAAYLAISDIEKAKEHLDHIRKMNFEKSKVEELAEQIEDNVKT